MIKGIIKTPLKIKGVLKTSKIYPVLEDLTVIPSGDKQVFNHSNSYGYDNVIVEAVETEQLDITPNTENQEFTGLYSKVKIAGDSDLLPENIKSGVNLFGVEGTGNVVGFEINNWDYLFNNGARREILYDLMNMSNGVTSMLSTFNTFAGLETLDLRNYDFSKNTSLHSTWRYCTSLKEIITDGGLDCTNVGTFYQMCQTCTGLKKFEIKNFTSSRVSNTSNMFNGCSSLRALIIHGTEVFPMLNTNMFSSTPIASGTGYVYVPDDLVESYKSATNWSTYADQIKPISEYVETN